MADSSSLPFASDGSFFVQFQRLQQQQQQQQTTTTTTQDVASSSTAAGFVDAAPPPAAPDPLEQGSEFLPSTSFTGAKSGYMFKSDEHGLGYYQDIGLQGWLQKRQELAKAKPKSIKANKSIGKIPSRGGEPAAKKAKTDAADGKPKYIREMEKYKQLSCSGGTKHDRPLVK